MMLDRICSCGGVEASSGNPLTLWRDTDTSYADNPLKSVSEKVHAVNSFNVLLRTLAAPTSKINGRHRDLGTKLTAHPEITATETYKHWKSVASNHEGILVDPNINYGSPVSYGAMIPVSRIVGYLYATGNLDRLLRDFPALDKDKVERAVLYAVDLLGG